MMPQLDLLLFNISIFHTKLKMCNFIHLGFGKNIKSGERKARNDRKIEERCRKFRTPEKIKH